MRGEFVDAIEIEVEFDEARERGLIERICDDGAGEGDAGVVGGVDVDEPLGDGEEVFGAEVGLVEIVRQEKTSGVGVVEAEVRDGEEAVERAVDLSRRGATQAIVDGFGQPVAVRELHVDFLEATGIEFT